MRKLLKNIRFGKSYIELIQKISRFTDATVTIHFDDLKITKRSQAVYIYISKIFKIYKKLPENLYYIDNCVVYPFEEKNQNTITNRKYVYAKFKKLNDATHYLRELSLSDDNFYFMLFVEPIYINNLNNKISCRLPSYVNIKVAHCYLLISASQNSMSPKESLSMASKIEEYYQDFIEEKRNHNIFENRKSSSVW